MKVEVRSNVAKNPYLRCTAQNVENQIKTHTEDQHPVRQVDGAFSASSAKQVRSKNQNMQLARL